MIESASAPSPALPARGREPEALMRALLRMQMHKLGGLTAEKYRLRAKLIGRKLKATRALLDEPAVAPAAKGGQAHFAPKTPQNEPVPGGTLLAAATG